jgi:phosphopentomutase
MLAAWDDAQGLLIITSDHGNIEDKEKRTHTRNLVPTIVVGPDHRQISAEITDLTHIAPLVRTFLTIE